MDPPLLSNSSENSNPDMAQSDGVSTSSSSRHAEMWSYLWIPLLFLFSKELSLARAEQSVIFIPTQLMRDSANLYISRCPAPDAKLNFRPVIGILSQPGDGASGRLNNASNASYIAASYVKFVESAGARVIPLIFNEPPEILDAKPLIDMLIPNSDAAMQKLNMTNGVLFTGGSAKNCTYYQTVKSIFEKVLAKNVAGDYFPLYAICLGFELLTRIISKDEYILERFNASNQASTLDFLENTNISRTPFQRFPPNLLKKLTTDCLVMQNHIYGISPGRLLENPDLSSFFKILTTCADKDNKVYVSTVQAHRYPVTAFQWHPEKNAFEWGSSMIPHSDDAIQVTQHIANFFVSEARKSLNIPCAQEVRDNLIYNYSPTYGGKEGKGYDEVYIFT